MVYKCDVCEKDFDYTQESLEKMTEGEYEVDYFTCPHCGKKYHVFTIDNRMRELVTERRKIANQLRVFKVRMSKGITVHQKHISKLQREDRKLKQQQMDLFHDLKKIGVEILAKTEKPEAEDAELPQTEA